MTAPAPTRPAVTIGIDIGGTKIAAAVVQFDGHQLQIPVTIRREATPAGSAAILAVCCELVDELRLGHDVEAIGVGAPGVIDGATGTVRAAGAVIPGWTGAQVAPILHRHSGLPVRVENDVRSFARAEAALGAGRGLDRCLYAAFGTGVGGAIVLDGALLDSPRSTVGELAHLTVAARGSRPCGCGSYGHLESVASGPAMAAEYALRTGALAGTTLEQVGSSAAADDVAALGVIRDAADVAGRTLAGLFCALDLDAVVIGGGACDVHPGFLRILADSVEAARWPRVGSVVVRRSRFGAAAPIIGAALLGVAAIGKEPVGADASGPG